MKMRSWVYSTLSVLLYILAAYFHKVHASPEREVHNLQFGIRSGRGWFRFELDGLGVVEETNLAHVPHIFPQPSTREASQISRTYQSTASSRSVTMTIHSRHAVSLLLLRSEHVVEIVPRHLYRVGESGRTLAEGVTHVATFDNTTKGPWDDQHTCGAYVVKSNPKDTLTKTVVDHTKAPLHMGSIRPSSLRQDPGLQLLDSASTPGGGTGKKDEAMNRRLEVSVDAEEVNDLSLMGRGRRLRAKAWMDCYEDQVTPRLMDIGIIADYGFFKSYGSDVSNTMDAIEVIIANTNLVYYYQLNIHIRARQVIIVDAPIIGATSCSESEAPTFVEVLEQDPDSGTCCHDIETMLALMKNFSVNGTTTMDPDIAGTPIPQTYADVESDTVPKLQLAHWHFLSNCYSQAACQNQGACTIGVGFVNEYYPKSTVCVRGINTAVSFRRPQTWLVFAHELGHNMGAPHSFEEGQGSTGGIMDYGDGKYLGEYQFNEQYRRDGMCRELNAIIQFDRCDEDTYSLFPAYSGQICRNREDYFPCPVGVCLNEICTPLETQLQVQSSTEAQTYRVEIAEFGPISPWQTPITAPFAISIEDGCGVDPFPASFMGTIVVIERSGCPPKTIVTNAEAVGAVAVVITNDQDGAADPVPGDDYSIPTVMIALLDGVELKRIIMRSTNVTGLLGGLPASDQSLFTSAFSLSDFQLLLAALCAIPLIGIVYGAARLRRRGKRRERRLSEVSTGITLGRPPTILDIHARSSGSEATPKERAESEAESFARWLRRSTFGIH